MFEKGDKVTHTDEDLEGVVLKILSDKELIIQTLDGFEMPVLSRFLIKLPARSEIQVSNAQIAGALQQKQTKKRKTNTVKPKERNLPKLEVDLHIEKLLKKHTHLSNYQMLDIQIDTAKRQLEFAITKRITKVVFIHGVGEGVLKSELRYLFQKYDGVSITDADYQKYGLGATQVYIKQGTTLY